MGAVIVDGDRVVLVKRAHEPLKGEWSLPGGTVEVGETLAEAVAREVREETGLNVHVGPLVEVLDRVHRDRDERVEYHFVLLDYRCTVVSGTLDARVGCVRSLLGLEKRARALRIVGCGAAGRGQGA